MGGPTWCSQPSGSGAPPTDGGGGAYASGGGGPPPGPGAATAPPSSPNFAWGDTGTWTWSSPGDAVIKRCYSSKRDQYQL